MGEGRSCRSNCDVEFPICDKLQVTKEKKNATMIHSGDAERPLPGS